MTKTYELSNERMIIADVDEEHHMATVSVYVLDDLVKKANKADAIDKIRSKYLEMLKAYEEELQKHMSEDKYAAFATKVAKTSFLAEVTASPNEDFRNTVFENWDDITRD